MNIKNCKVGMIIFHVKDKDKDDCTKFRVVSINSDSISVRMLDSEELFNDVRQSTIKNYMTKTIGKKKRLSIDRS